MALDVPVPPAGLAAARGAQPKVGHLRMGGRAVEYRRARHSAQSAVCQRELRGSVDTAPNGKYLHIYIYRYIYL